jgi:hypothetical protein
VAKSYHSKSISEVPQICWTEQQFTPIRTTNKAIQILKLGGWPKLPALTPNRSYNAHLSQWVEGTFRTHCIRSSLSIFAVSVVWYTIYRKIHMFWKKNKIKEWGRTCLCSYITNVQREARNIKVYNRYREFKSFIKCRNCTFRRRVRLFRISK